MIKFPKFNAGNFFRYQDGNEIIIGLIDRIIQDRNGLWYHYIVLRSRNSHLLKRDGRMFKKDSKMFLKSTKISLEESVAELI